MSHTLFLVIERDRRWYAGTRIVKISRRKPTITKPTEQALLKLNIMINIFIVIFCFSLSLAFFDPFFFIGYLIGMAFFGLFQAIFMANAGGAWDNAKKIVEVELKMKNNLPAPSAIFSPPEVTVEVKPEHIAAPRPAVVTPEKPSA